MFVVQRQATFCSQLRVNNFILVQESGKISCVNSNIIVFTVTTGSTAMHSRGTAQRSLKVSEKHYYILTLLAITK